MGFNTKDRSTSVEDLILNFSRTDQLIMQRLRSLILKCLPAAKEQIMGGVPFYRHHRMICFIWPPSVTTEAKKNKGSKKDRRRVGLGFFQGYRMANEDGALLAEGRKQIYYIYFQSHKEIDDNQIRSLLFEAGMLDDLAVTARKQKK